MKKNIVCILAAMVVGTVAFAQNSGKTWWNSYAPGIDQKVMINAGVGLGAVGSDIDITWAENVEYKKESIIPLSVSVDYKLPINLPITLGGTFIYSQWKADYIANGYYVGLRFVEAKTYEFKYNNFGFGARGRYHFNFVKNLDVYAGVTLGYVVQTWDRGGYDGDFSTVSGSIRDNKNNKEEYENESFILFAIDAGARYFFSKNIGVFLELGYGKLQVAGLGVAVKF